MPIALECPACGRRLRARDEAAGRRVRCRNCGAAVPVPAAGAAAPPAPPGPGRSWDGFAAGCRLAQWAAWVEFAGFALAAGLVAVQVVRADRPLLWGQLPYAVAALFVVSAVGTGLVLAGRALMLTLPAGTGATLPLVGAVLLTAAKLIAAGVTLVLYWEAAVGGDDPRAAAWDAEWAGRVWSVGYLAGAVADLSLVPALAVAGGAVPSTTLRRRAGEATAGLQVVAVVAVAGAVAVNAYAVGERAAPVAAVGLFVILQFAAAALLNAVYVAGGRAGVGDEHD